MQLSCGTACLDEDDGGERLADDHVLPETATLLSPGRRCCHRQGPVLSFVAYGTPVNQRLTGFLLRDRLSNGRKPTSGGPKQTSPVRLASTVLPKGREHSSMKCLIAPCALAIGASLALTACDPYDPGERALGGAAIGAGSGAAIGAAVGGGHGAAVGALVGGAVGAVTGAATTPPPPPPPRAYYGYVYPPPPLPPPPPTPPPAVYYNPY